MEKLIQYVKRNPLNYSDEDFITKNKQNDKNREQGSEIEIVRNCIFLEKCLNND